MIRIYLNLSAMRIKKKLDDSLVPKTTVFVISDHRELWPRLNVAAEDMVVRRKLAAG